MSVWLGSARCVPASQMRPVSTQLHPPLSLFSVLYPRLQGRVSAAGTGLPVAPPGLLLSLHSYSLRIDLHVGCNCGLRWPGPLPPPVPAPRTARPQHCPGFLLLPPAALYSSVHMCTVLYSAAQTEIPAAISTPASKHRPDSRAFEETNEMEKNTYFPVSFYGKLCTTK